MSSVELIGSVSTAYGLSVEVLWKIARFFQLPKSRFFEIISPIFQFQGQNWRLRLWPNAFPSYIECNLMMLDSPAAEHLQDFRCHFELRMFDGSSYTIDRKKFNIPLNREGWNSVLISQKLTRLLLNEDRESLLPGGQLKLCCRLSVVKAENAEDSFTQTESLKAVDPRNLTELVCETNVKSGDSLEDTKGRTQRTNVLETLSQNLKDLYIAGKDCDVTIKVENETFRAHRAILGARTPVLAAMFSHNMTEAETGVIQVDDCDPKAFTIFLLFVYSGATEKLTTESVKPVYYIADKYDLPELKEECVKYMLSNLTIDTVCSVIEIATKHGEKALLEKATKFFQKNAKEIFLRPHWDRFMVENTTQAKELIVLSFNFASTK